MCQSLPACVVFKKKFSRAESYVEEILAFCIPLVYLWYNSPHQSINEWRGERNLIPSTDIPYCVSNILTNIRGWTCLDLSRCKFSPQTPM